MEKVKNIIIAILTIATLLLGSFIIYDKFINTEKKENNKEQTTTTTTNPIASSYENYLTNLKNSSETEVIKLNTPVGTRYIYLDENGNVFLLYHEQYTYNNEEEIKSLTNETGKVYGIKLNIKNIVDLFEASGIAQSGINVIYALDKDGNVYYVTDSFAYDEDKIVSTNYEPLLIKELKEIVNIETIEQISIGGNHNLTVIATDFNGKKYDILDILSKNGYSIYNESAY